MTEQIEEKEPQNWIFTIAQGGHIGYPAPGGKGVHRFDPEDGNIWEIQFEEERFVVYRRWPAPVEGEVVELKGEDNEPVV